MDMNAPGRMMVLLTALLSLSAVVAVAASSAGAVTWHNSGDATFTATGGGGTLSATAVTLGCSGSDAKGTVPATPLVGSTLTIAGTVTFTGCTMSGQGVSLDCGYAFTATTQPAAGTVSGSLDTTCGVYLATVKVCHIGGTMTATYTNPSGVTPGRFTVTTNSNLTVSNGQVGTCPIGSDDKGHLTQLTFNMLDTVAPLGPVLTRTA
jgi:hypothetical protein